MASVHHVQELLPALARRSLLLHVGQFYALKTNVSIVAGK